MNFKLIWATLLLQLFTPALHAQDEKEAAAAVYAFFDAMQRADSAGLSQMFAPQARLETVGRTAQGKDTVTATAIAGFCGRVGRFQPGELDEKIEMGGVRVSGNLAVVWAPYRFYFKGKFSHCGVNSFQLVRLNGSWRIQSILDTRQTTGCG